MIVIPKEEFKHPENMNKILDELYKFFNKDMYVEGEREQQIRNMKELLKDEPIIYDKYIKGES